MSSTQSLGTDPYAARRSREQHGPEGHAEFGHNTAWRDTRSSATIRPRDNESRQAPDAVEDQRMLGATAMGPM